jgi:hypothetical protein
MSPSGIEVYHGEEGASLLQMRIFLFMQKFTEPPCKYRCIIIIKITKALYGMFSITFPNYFVIYLHQC